jgi:hypothetical protein
MKYMKRKEKPLTMDEAVEKLAAITDSFLAKLSPEEREKRLRDFSRFIPSAKKKRLAKLSRPRQTSQGRRRARAGA